MITGESIRTARQKLRESQAEFGKRFGVNQSTVNRWENKGVPDRGTARMAIEHLMGEIEIRIAGPAQ